MNYSHYLNTKIAAEASGPIELCSRSGFIMITLLAIIVLLTLLTLDQCGVLPALGQCGTALPVFDEVTMTAIR